MAIHVCVNGKIIAVEQRDVRKGGSNGFTDCRVLVVVVRLPLGFRFTLNPKP